MDHQHAHNSGTSSDACCSSKRHIDWLLWVSTVILVGTYALHFLSPDTLTALPGGTLFSESVVELLHKMWWGLLLGILFVGILAGIPKELVTSILGKPGTMGGVIRATIGGVLLDLCSHGILLVGMQLYKRGASLGQTMAFLIASPWNSLSLTLILWALVGLKWTLVVLGLSLGIALISGIVFDRLVQWKVLPENPNTQQVGETKGFWSEVRSYFGSVQWTPKRAASTLQKGLHESKMILRWIFFGVVLASLIRAYVPADLFAQVFGPTVLGLLATLIFATILEVCSEGSMPVAVDFLLRANAPGNMFAFLMTGVSTDYTEILSLKETTGSWKIAFFLPLVTVPQVVLISLLLNGM